MALPSWSRVTTYFHTPTHWERRACSTALPRNAYNVSAALVCGGAELGPRPFSLLARVALSIDPTV